MFPQLGRAIRAAFRRAAGSVERLTSLLVSRDPEAARIIAATHVDGRRVARSTHGVLLPTRASLTPIVAARWRRSAIDHADRTLALAAPVMNLGITKAEAARYATTLLRQTVWAGQDTEAQQIATDAEAIWKEWVRAFPRAAHRDHHDMLEGRIIPADSLFTLPGGRNAGAEVYGPRDWLRLSDAGEWVECGHALRFHRTATARDAA